MFSFLWHSKRVALIHLFLDQFFWRGISDNCRGRSQRIKKGKSKMGFMMFFYFFLLTLKTVIRKIQPPHSRQHVGILFSSGLFFSAFFVSLNTFIDEKRLLPPPGIPSHSSHFFHGWSSCGSFAESVWFTKQLIPQRQESDDKWHGAAGLALSAPFQPFPSHFLFILQRLWKHNLNTQCFTSSQ